MREDIYFIQLLNKFRHDFFYGGKPFTEGIEKAWRVLQFELTVRGCSYEQWQQYCFDFIDETLINTFDREFSEEEMRKLKELHPELKDL